MLVLMLLGLKSKQQQSPLWSRRERQREVEILQAHHHHQHPTLQGPETSKSHQRVLERKQGRQHDSSSIQREDAGAPPGVALLLLHPPASQRKALREESRGSGPEPLHHQGYGGHRAEQEGVGPGLRGHPEAAVVRRRTGVASHHPPSQRTLPGGDPEETGRSAGAEKMPRGGTSQTPRRETGARTGGGAESSGGTEQLHQAGQGEAGAPHGAQQREEAGTPRRHAGAPAGEGQALCGGFMTA